MRYSAFFPKTIKEAPSEEVAVNAKLLLRGGFIDKMMAGSYTLLPLGRIVERKIENIIKEEMDATGAQEVLMPLLHPKQIWNETGRWDTAREVMYQFKKEDREYALSFTHEEIVLDLMRKHVTTYRDLPVKIYHFSTKFRNELRAKSGILRGREFLMKDLYSVHDSAEDLDRYYEEVKNAYIKVFKRVGLDAIVTEAGGGVFTDSTTHEFQVISESGEDEIVYCPGGDFSQNTEICKVNEGKMCDLGHGPLKKVKAIEVGNIFRFGTVYSEKMNVSYTDKNGEKKYVYFGSYGIGLTRLMGVIAEVFHDEHGPIWPESVAPFTHFLMSIGKDEQTEKLYNTLKEKGIEVLYDDRDVSPGQKFADCDLLGIPYRIVVSSKLEEGTVELKKRSENTVTNIQVDQLFA